jgi:hypothetical protein
MSNCESKCDCGNPSVKYYGPHDPDCRSLDVCDGERGIWCEKHWQEKLHEHGWMSGLTGGSTDAQTQDQMRQDMIDAGRGHLLPDVLADRIDMARMRMKDGQ